LCPVAGLYISNKVRRFLRDGKKIEQIEKELEEQECRIEGT
jgi:hypothetical protein